MLPKHERPPIKKNVPLEPNGLNHRLVGSISTRQSGMTRNMRRLLHDLTHINEDKLPSCLEIRRHTNTNTSKPQHEGKHIAGPHEIIRTRGMCNNKYFHVFFCFFTGRIKSGTSSRNAWEDKSWKLPSENTSFRNDERTTKFGKPKPKRFVRSN